MDTITAEYDISQYCMDIDVDYSDHVCRCYGDMCRCSRITNARVSHIDHSLLPKIKIYTKADTKRSRKKIMSPSVMQLYCIDRLMYINGCYDEDNYEVSIGNGYYGQEVIGISFANNNKLIDDILTLLTKCKTEIEQIKFVLNLEYSVIRNIQHVTDIKIENIEVEQLLQSGYFSAVKRPATNVSIHFDEPLPIAVFIDDILIDGYSRLYKAIDAHMNKVKIIRLRTGT